MASHTNLLVRLHKLASRQDENFLTESLAWLLQHLRENEPEVAVRGFRMITGTRLDLPASGAANVDVQTQVVGIEGRPDLELRTPAHFVIVEAKSESSPNADQLNRYRARLAASGFAKTTLVFLTRDPVDAHQFAQADCFVRWLEIAEWLDEERRRQRIDPLTKFVLDQFFDFLRARNMTLAHVSHAMPGGVHALANFLNMLVEAVAACKVSATKNAGWDYIGLKVDGKFWVGIYFTDPDKLRFVTSCKIQRDAAEALGVGEVWEESWIPGRNRWVRSAELGSEEIHFYSRTKVSQMQWLQKFVIESLAMGRAIVSPDQPASEPQPPVAVEAVPLD
jgi:hypothetical protein